MIGLPEQEEKNLQNPNFTHDILRDGYFTFKLNFLNQKILYPKAFQKHRLKDLIYQAAFR